MTKVRRRVFAIAAMAVLLLAGGASAAAAGVFAQDDPQVPGAVDTAAVCEFPVSATNPYLQTKTVTSSSARFYTTTDWTNLECGRLVVSVPRGQHGGLVVRTDAELTCNGPSPDQTQWCQARVLIGNTEGFPKETEADGSFAWDQSTTDAGAWESNSFTRSLTLTCPRATTTEAPCLWAVQVQVRNHAPGHNFRVDGSTVETQVTYYP